MPRIVTLAFNEAILLHLLLLGALVCACMASEIDYLAGMPGLRLGLSALALGTRPAKDYLFQVLAAKKSAFWCVFWCFVTPGPTEPLYKYL